MIHLLLLSLLALTSNGDPVDSADKSRYSPYWDSRVRVLAVEGNTSNSFASFIGKASDLPNLPALVGLTILSKEVAPDMAQECEGCLPILSIVVFVYYDENGDYFPLGEPSRQPDWIGSKTGTGPITNGQGTWPNFYDEWGNLVYTLSGSGPSVNEQNSSSGACKEEENSSTGVMECVEDYACYCQGEFTLIANGNYEYNHTDIIKTGGSAIQDPGVLYDDVNEEIFVVADWGDDTGEGCGWREITEYDIVFDSLVIGSISIQVGCTNCAWEEY